MTPTLRYIITRPCLSEGTLTVAKYLRELFPAALAGQILHLTDDQGREYPAQMSDNAQRLLGLNALYHDHNLDVNDVLLLSPLEGEHYRVSCVVKPHTERLSPTYGERPAQLTRRVVVNATPHVREVRLEVAPAADAHPARPGEGRPSPEPAEPGAGRGADAVPATSRVAETRTPLARAEPQPEPQRSEPQRPEAPVVTEVRNRPPQRGPSARPEQAPRSEPAPRREPPRPGNAPQTPSAPPAPAVASAAPLALETLADQLSELAHLTGYQVEYLGGTDLGPVRLRADLGAHGYDVMLALSEAEQQHPAFGQGTYRAQLTWEKDQVPDTPRLTREALGALLEHARLAPLTPIDLRGYWNTSSFDLDSVASLAELVSAHLVQRGTFTYVLGTLAQQPAHSVVDPARLAERLGSGVNTAELHSILETLCRAPFMALMPLPGNQYYLRSDVPRLLTELSDYAQSVNRRLQPGRVRA